MIKQVYEANRDFLISSKGSKNGIKGRSIFSKDRKKRYFLEKRWGSDEKNVLVALMMNPSHADELAGDDTVDQLIRQAKNNDYDALYVLNLSPLKNPQSKNLRMGDFDDDLNWKFIRAAFSQTDKDIFIGWGMKGQKGLKRQLKRNKETGEIYSLLSKAAKRYVSYDIIASTSNSKYNPKYYVPHPRPIPSKNSYLNVPFKKLINYKQVIINPK